MSPLVIKFNVKIIKGNLLILIPAFNLMAQPTNFSLFWWGTDQGQNLNKVKEKSSAVELFNKSHKTEVVMVYHLSKDTLKKGTRGPKMESLVLSPTPANQRLILNLTSVSASPRNGILNQSVWNFPG